MSLYYIFTNNNNFYVVLCCGDIRIMTEHYSFLSTLFFTVLSQQQND